MDLSLVLEASIPATVEFCGEEIELEIYTAGRNRLPTEINAQVRAISDDESLDSYTRMVRSLKMMFPHVIKSWNATANGEPLEMSGELFNALVTDALLFEISSKCNEIWANPTKAEVLVSTSAQVQ